VPEAFLQQIDWSRPWLQPIASIAKPIVMAENWRAATNQAAAAAGISNASGMPIQFVFQQMLPAGVAYESFIFDTGQVPTRENLHDFFNALIWLAYPAVKQRLNKLQADEIAEASATPVRASGSMGRGKLRDAATIFDENAAFFVSESEEILEGLRSHEWEKVFLEQRHFFESRCEVLLFGHALLEKLVVPFKGITAHACCFHVGRDYFHMAPPARREKISSILVARSLGRGLNRSIFNALPVAGVPGWWEGQTKDFYLDKSVFRPKTRN
jgi:hypothetical protein